MAQVAYHVQLTWLLVTAVTPDRLEITRSSAEAIILYIWSMNVVLAIACALREHAMHAIDDSILSIVSTNEVRPGALALEQRTVLRMPGDCID